MSAVENPAAVVRRSDHRATLLALDIVEAGDANGLILLFARHAAEARAEALREAALRVACHADDRGGRYRPMDWHDGYMDGCKGAADAILARLSAPAPTAPSAAVALPGDHQHEPHALSRAGRGVPGEGASNG